tara:strand:- start:183 stop:449 length:267 start_codon:yes stop_codon:yes gene_type:complete
MSKSPQNTNPQASMVEVPVEGSIILSDISLKKHIEKYKGQLLILQDRKREYEAQLTETAINIERHIGALMLLNELQRVEDNTDVTERV